MSSADRIYTTVNGSLNSSSTFDFKVYIEDLQGVLLFIIDTSSNQFEMSVKPFIEKGSRFMIRFNISFQEVDLRELCLSMVIIGGVTSRQVGARTAGE